MKKQLTKPANSKGFFEEKNLINEFYFELQQSLSKEFLELENSFARVKKTESKKEFTKKEHKDDKNFSRIFSLKGEVFEKIGISVTNYKGKTPDIYSKSISEDSDFYFAGISVVVHPNSPFVPSTHLASRLIIINQERYWFSGSVDIIPTIKTTTEFKIFHNELKKTCDEFDINYYPKFKKWCEDYYQIKHRNDLGRQGGIFYDYFNNENWEKDFEFVKNICQVFSCAYLPIVEKNYKKTWDIKQKLEQQIKRGHFAEFSLLYDRGIKLGLATNCNLDTTFMALPPSVCWP
jgi:coproporphyrinogen III oxidase